MPTLEWDFHGPDGAGTAEHFREHLDGFLGVNALTGCETRVERPGPHHAVVVCEAPSEWAEAIARALRPVRRKS
ncbi:MAG: hypothetical protein KIT58_09935 [Planctomycetota bacterium]|nr:hypothetical protein [Planctomycetota bacterium]